MFTLSFKVLNTDVKFISLNAKSLRFYIYFKTLMFIYISKCLAFKSLKLL